MNEGAMYELPVGWVWTRLGEVCLDPQYGWTTSAKTEGALHLLRTTDITSGIIDWNTVPFCHEEPPEKEKYLLKDGDIVISRAGSVGYSYLIKNPKEAIFASYLIRFRSLIYKKYFAYFLKSPFYWNSISEKSLGIAIPNVNASKLKQIFIPLPSLPEQRAIVSKIEQLFSDLDSSIENFKKAQAQLKRYRQSVLKAACEGRLMPTEAELARKEGRTYEPADVLLARILKERCEKWNGRGKYTELAAPDTKGLPELPEGWSYTFIDALLSMERTGIKTGPFGSLLKKHEHRIEGIPVLGIENIEAMRFIAGSKIHITKEKSNQLSSYDALPNDVLISRSGTVGEVCVVPEGLGEARISTNLMRVTLAPNGMLPLFFIFLFNGSLFVLNQVLELCKGSTRNFLNQDILFSLIFPIPPLAEQCRIVSEIERRFSISDKMEATITESLQKAESLRQSILKKAFEGKLLNKIELEEARKAPDWEPAEKLLEKIKAEKKEKNGQR
ncbi:MAG TPA: restriction endonuclease subunit S [Candidatus Methylomirabilis sp.]|nr:restriction endonuclease subunit S [Candidatus Methylomirabilis sp.]